jgi:hypothetical protein
MTCGDEEEEVVLAPGFSPVEGDGRDKAEEDLSDWLK